MTQKTLVLDQIEVEVLGFFTTHHHFRTEADTIGKFTFRAFGDGATFTSNDGRELIMHKPKWHWTVQELVEDGRLRGTADRRGVFSRDMVVEFDGRRYQLVPEGTFSRGWFLQDAAGNVLLECQPKGVFNQNSYLTVWDAIDADLVAFAYYLIYTRRQEEAAGAAAAAS